MRYGVQVPNPLDGWDVECDLRQHMVATVKRQETDRGVSLLPQMGLASDAAREAAD